MRLSVRVSVMVCLSDELGLWVRVRVWLGFRVSISKVHTCDVSGRRPDMKVKVS